VGVAIIRVNVIPESSKRKIEIKDNQILIYLKSPAKNNLANEELVNFLERIFNQKVRITKGKTSRKKTIYIANLTEDEAFRLLKEYSK